MKKIKMKEMTAVANNKKRLKIPGGWDLRIPEIEKFDSMTQKIYGRYHQSRGMTQLRAEQEVLNTFNEMWRIQWIRYQTNSVRYWAKKYAQRFPQMVEQDGTLTGFRAGWVQDTYVPGMNPGKAGKVVMNNLLKKMKEESND